MLRLEILDWPQPTSFQGTFWTLILIFHSSHITLCIGQYVRRKSFFLLHAFLNAFLFSILTSFLLPVICFLLFHFCLFLNLGILAVMIFHKFSLIRCFYSKLVQIVMLVFPFQTSGLNSWWQVDRHTFVFTGDGWWLLNWAGGNSFICCSWTHYIRQEGNLQSGNKTCFICS